MSITNNGKQKRNKKKKRLIKLLIIVIILFILLMLADTLLLQHRKNVDREQRTEKSRSNRGTGKSSHCNTDTCSYTHTYPNADSYGNTNTCTGKGICF